MKVDNIPKAEKSKACLNLELIVGKEISIDKGSYLTNTFCPNSTDKNKTVVPKLCGVEESLNCEGGPLKPSKEQKHS